MWTDHRIEIRKLAFRVFALRRRESDESSRISLRWPIPIVNPIDKTKLSCNTPHRRSTTVPLETYPFIESSQPWIQ